MWWWAWGLCSLLEGPEPLKVIKNSPPPPTTPEHRVETRCSGPSTCNPRLPVQLAERTSSVAPGYCSWQRSFSPIVEFFYRYSYHLLVLESLYSVHCWVRGGWAVLRLVPENECTSQPLFAEICASGGHASVRCMARALCRVPLPPDLYLLKVELHFIPFACSIKPGT